MAIRRRVWVGSALAGTMVVMAGISAGYRSVPGPAELSDPLGSPARVAREVIGSAIAFDHHTATLVAQHSELRRRMERLRSVAAGLGELEGRSRRVRALVAAADEEASRVVVAAKPLPGRLGAVTDRSLEGATTVVTLRSTTESLTAGLAEVAASLRAVLPDMAALAPRTRALADRLEDLRRDSEAFRLLPAAGGAR